MMLKLLFFMCLTLVCCDGSCEPDNIRACGSSCKESGHAMVKYSKAEGCVCQ